MDERALFDRFHEALDIEPRPGAYERLRTNLTSQPVALRRRPAFRMRFSKMGFRMVAALAAVLIAIALIATFVAVHSGPVGQVPAHSPQNVVAYRAMIAADYHKFELSTSDHCLSIQDDGCSAETALVIAAMQKWIDDVQSFRTPPQLAALDAALRAHLQDAIDDLSAAVSFQKAGDSAGFTLAINAALYERGWLDPARSGLEGTFPGTGNSYRDAVDLARQSLTACLGSTPSPAELTCQGLVTHRSCTGASASKCDQDTQAEGIKFETFLVGMAQHVAPSSQAAGYAKLQSDLVTVDGALLAVHRAVLHGASADAAEMFFTSAMIAAKNDLSAFG